MPKKSQVTKFMVTDNDDVNENYRTETRKHFKEKKT